MAKLRNRSYKDIYPTKLIKNEDGSVLMEDNKIIKRWQEYFRKLMNEENSRELREEVQVKVHTEVANITCLEIEKALKKKWKSGWTR